MICRASASGRIAARPSGIAPVCAAVAVAIALSFVRRRSQLSSPVRTGAERLQGTAAGLESGRAERRSRPRRLVGDIQRPGARSLGASSECLESEREEYEAEYRGALALLKEAEAQLYPSLAIDRESFSGRAVAGAAPPASRARVGANRVDLGVEYRGRRALPYRFSLEGLGFLATRHLGHAFGGRSRAESRRAGRQGGSGQCRAVRAGRQRWPPTTSICGRPDSLRKSSRRRSHSIARALEIAQNISSPGRRPTAMWPRRRRRSQATAGAARRGGSERGTFEHAIAVLTGHLPAEISIAEAPLRLTCRRCPCTAVRLARAQSDVAAADARCRRRTHSIGVAIGAYFPTIILPGSAAMWATRCRACSSGRIASGRSAEPRRHPVSRRFAGGGGGERPADLRSSHVANYRQTVLTAFQSVEDSLLALQVLRQEAEYQTQAVNLLGRRRMWH